MSSKTKIIVLHMREIIYTAIFAVLGIVILCLLFFMFFSGEKKSAAGQKKYAPGIYTSTVTLNNTNLEVEVAVDKQKINSIRISNLDETVTAMYPLIQPAIEELADQILESQSLDNIQLSEDNPYTSQILLNAIDEALKKAVVS
ncbi:hypothetical protein ABXS75_08025 [Roseburia hominis]